MAMGDDSSEDEARSVRYATRQPILAADETVIGYKLTFRTDVVSHFAWKESGEQAVLQSRCRVCWD